MNKQLTLVFAGVALCHAAAVARGSQEHVVSHPELATGAWERARAGGIDGIFLSISTHLQGATGPSETTTQGVHIRVYHREAGNETGGWDIANRFARPEMKSGATDTSARRYRSAEALHSDPRLTAHRRRWRRSGTRRSPIEFKNVRELVRDGFLSAIARFDG